MSGSGKTVSLVLGSGGARGLAHIGVINWLKDNGYEIHSISGASMGALVGGIHAAGKLDVYSDWVCKLRRHDVLRYLDLSFGGRGLIKGERIIEVLRDMIGEYLIEDLPISYTAVATDIDREREVWLNRGPLFDAIRASIAVPTVFTPHRYHNRRLVDGGLLNPLPMAPTLKDLTDLTVAVNVHARAQYSTLEPITDDDAGDDDDDEDQGRIAAWIEDLQKSMGGKKQDDGLGFFDIVLKSLDAMQNTVVRFKLAAHTPDVLIDVPRNVCMAYEFYRARELIDLGWEKADKAFGDHL